MHKTTFESIKYDQQLISFIEIRNGFNDWNFDLPMFIIKYARTRVFNKSILVR